MPKVENYKELILERMKWLKESCEEVDRPNWLIYEEWRDLVDLIHTLLFLELITSEFANNVKTDLYALLEDFFYWEYKNEYTEIN